MRHVVNASWWICRPPQNALAPFTIHQDPLQKNWYRSHQAIRSDSVRALLCVCLSGLFTPEAILPDNISALSIVKALVKDPKWDPNWWRHNMDHPHFRNCTNYWRLNLFVPVFIICGQSGGLKDLIKHLKRWHLGTSLVVSYTSLQKSGRRDLLLVKIKFGMFLTWDQASTPNPGEFSTGSSGNLYQDIKCSF